MRCCRVSNPPFDKGKVALFVLMGVSLRDLGWGNSCRWYILCLKHVFNFTQVTFWLDSVNTAMDTYTWLFQRLYLSPSQVFGAEPVAAPKPKKRGTGVDAVSLAGASSTRSCLLPNLRHFLTVLLPDAAFAGTTVTTGFSTSVSSLTPRQLESLHRLRAISVCRLFTLLAVLLTPAPGAALPGLDTVSTLVSQGILSQRLYNLILTSVLAPESIGIDTVDSQVYVYPFRPPL